MKIVFVLDLYGVPGNGMTLSATRMAKCLRDRGHEIAIICGNENGDAAVHATGIKRYPILYQVARSQGMFLAHPREDVVEKVIGDADVVHFMLPFELERKAKKIADRLNIPSTAGIHLQPENITSTLYLERFGFLNEMLYKIHKRFYDRFDHIHCPSRMIQKQLDKRDAKAKLHVISNGVSEKFAPRAVEKPNSWRDKFVITMVGRYSREKRQDILIEAIRRSKHEKDIQLVLAGKGPWRKKLVRLSKKLTNPVAFSFYQQEDLIDVLNASDLYVHASDIDIEAISCLEAFACGLVPVISDSETSATSQFALDEKNRFRAGDADHLAKKIDWMVNHPQEREKLSFRYREFSDRFRLERSVEKMEAMFEEAIRDHKNRKD